MRDIEKELFLNNFDISNYNQDLVDSIECFEEKIKGELPIEPVDLLDLIEQTVDIRFVDTSEIGSMGGLFRDSKYEKLDLSRWDTKNVFSMSSMFEDSKYLKSINLSSFSTNNVEYIDMMFKGCFSLENLDLSSFENNGIRDLESMFSGCRSLESVDLSNFTMNKVLNTQFMFSGCFSLGKVNLIDLDVKSIVNKQCMFDRTPLVFDLEKENINLLEVDEMGISAFKTIHFTSDVKKVFELDLDLLALTYQDTGSSSVLIEKTSNNGVLGVFDISEDIYAVEVKDCLYSVKKHHIKELKRLGIVVECEDKKQNRKKVRKI